MGKKNKRLTVPALQKRRCGPFTRETRIEWAGHVWRADGSMLKGALTYMARGRLRQRWKNSVKELLEDIGVEWEQAYNRVRWKEVVLAAKSLNGS